MACLLESQGDSARRAKGLPIGIHLLDVLVACQRPKTPSHVGFIEVHRVFSAEPLEILLPSVLVKEPGFTGRISSMGMS